MMLAAHLWLFNAALSAVAWRPHTVFFDLVCASLLLQIVAEDDRRSTP